MLRATLGTEHRLDICRRSYREILAAPVKRPEGAAPKAEGAIGLSPGFQPWGTIPSTDSP
jgi:hypothetical protein